MLGFSGEEVEVASVEDVAEISGCMPSVWGVWAGLLAFVLQRP